MATSRRIRRASGPAEPTSRPFNTPSTRRKTIEYVLIEDIEPYEFNPRKNERAVQFVANSIRQFGFYVPVIIDRNNVLVAGHTRVEAAKSLDMVEVPAIRATDLSPEQIDAFRIADNKVAEQAVWDNDLLSREITRLGDLGVSWTDYGFQQEEVDCLREIVANDCLDTGTLPAADTSEHNERRAPDTARFVLGELTFFIPRTVYNTWVAGLRQLHDFDEDDIVRHIKEQLGIPV